MVYRQILTGKKYGTTMKSIKKIKAPDFKIKSTNDKIIDLKSINTDFIVLYFYPKDDTPGCTIETNDFNKLYKEFKKLNCKIFGISLFTKLLTKSNVLFSYHSFSYFSKPILLYIFMFFLLPSR